jgi:two-component system LytT family sensor kinase
MHNPFLSNGRSFYSYVGIWIIAILFQVILITVSGQIPFVFALVDSLVNNFIYSAFGLGLWYPIFYGKSQDESIFNLIINNLFACLVTVGIWIGISYFLLFSIFSSNQEYLDFLRKSIPWRAGIGILYYNVIILVYYLIIYNRNIEENQVKEAELKALVKESELNSLKSQINPHFLFNSLNSISSLTMIQPAKAQEMIIKLSEFLRYSISNQEEKLTTLRDETGNINRYIDIEKIRFGKRLMIKQEIDETCFDLKLPGLILQPLMENAVKYGVYESIDESVIELICTCNSNALAITIRNTYDPDFINKKGEGIGLKNIRNRLRLLYNRDDLLLITEDSHKYEVKVLFPQK